MRSYTQSLSNIMEMGKDGPNRTAENTRSLFAVTIRHDMKAGFPLLTTKNINFDSVVAELLWFLSGSSNVHDLEAKGCKIWSANATAPYWKNAQFDGDMGRIYGVAWRRFQGVAENGQPVDFDQIAKLVDGLQNDPFGRRHIVTAWNPIDVELKRMCLPPCHILFQCHVQPNGVPDNPHILNLAMYQRSADFFLGVPFNIASYALLLKMLCHVTSMEPGSLHFTFGDAHVYHNHFNQVEKQLSRYPKTLPDVQINPDASKVLWEIKAEDISLLNYEPHGYIKAEMVV